VVFLFVQQKLFVCETSRGERSKGWKQGCNGVGKAMLLFYKLSLL
jgi:hypothetical protein